MQNPIVLIIKDYFFLRQRIPILIYYYIVNKKMKNNLTAFTFAVLAATGGGWLYEISFFHPLKMVMSNNTIFLINGQILCLILLAYELKKMQFKPNLIILENFIIFVVFSILLFSEYDRVAYTFRLAFDNPFLFRWFCRIPTCLFLISLLGGIRNQANP